MWGGVICETYLRCTVQGKTALIRAAKNGDEALLKQLIGAKANLNAKDVIYCCCARVSLSECSEFPALDITLKILCMLKFLVSIILHELSLFSSLITHLLLHSHNHICVVCLLRACLCVCENAFVRMCGCVSVRVFVYVCVFLFVCL